MSRYNVEKRCFADGSEEIVISDRILGTDEEGAKDNLYKIEQKKQHKKENKSVCFISDSLSESEKAQRKERSEYESLRRARQNVSFLARCNMWDFFVTFTLAPDALALPSDVTPTYEQAAKLLNDEIQYLKKKYPDMAYLAVMEQGAKNGRWHAHALIRSKMLRHALVPSGHKNRNNQMTYNLMAYRIGYTKVEHIRTLSAVTRYISKYIGKSLGDIPVGKHRYWASRNLKTIKDCRIRYLFDDKEEKELLFKQMLQSCDSYFKAVIDVIDGVFHYFRFNAPALVAGEIVATT